jgi:hypothetical protein
MRERSESIMRMVCVALGALLLFQVVRVLVRHDPLAHLSIPALPTLSATVDAPTESNRTNVAHASGKGGTNAVSAALNAKGTNTTHEQALANPGSNSPARVAVTAQTGQLTNHSPSTDGTNTAAQAASKGKARNSPADLATKSPSAPRRPEANKKSPELPLPITARVVKITETELLGPIMHPLPMALLGIAGDMAFLRSPSGQTGLVKEGDELGGLKLLRIGTNRVLVEQDGKKQELMIFSGLGGDSLLPK